MVVVIALVLTIMVVLVVVVILEGTKVSNSDNTVGAKSSNCENGSKKEENEHKEA